tara:strand:+ start:798 stop:1403 length:606 start_codon:yes stop_codon:yes gene_type:complete
LNTAFLSGFLLSFSLILAIGPQNAFVLRQGLLKQHVLPIALFCTLSDIILILLGIFGFGYTISSFDNFSQYMFAIGGTWLLGYGFLRLKGAYLADSFLEASNEQESDIRLVLINCALLTWFNPHVYIDTLILIGTVSIRFEDYLDFGLGACLASFIFFFSLAFGARLLSPFMSSKKAWQILDLIIASIMFVLAFSMFQEVF